MRVGVGGLGVVRGKRLEVREGSQLFALTSLSLPRLAVGLGPPAGRSLVALDLPLNRGGRAAQIAALMERYTFTSQLRIVGKLEQREGPSTHTSCLLYLEHFSLPHFHN